MKIRLPTKLLQGLRKVCAPFGLDMAADGHLIDPAEKLEAADAIVFWTIKKLMQGWRGKTLSIKLELEDLIKIKRVLVTCFIRCQVAPDKYRIPAPRIEVLQPRGGRAPPPVAIFIPLPKLEIGSCARSELPADSAYLSKRSGSTCLALNPY